MRHGSLFSGIGGFDYAAQMMGWENVFHCEWNEFGQRVLKHYWPQAISYHDITKTDFTIHRGGIEIISGGFPCQPYSTAGKRLGKDDERHLWPEMLRAIREIQPRWVVGENVLGLVNWNGGLVFEEVQADLEAEGYEVQPFILPAASVNAPHRRDRVWFVAHTISARAWDKCGKISDKGGLSCEDWSKSLRQAHGTFGTSGIDTTNSNGTTPDTISERDSSPAESGEIKGNGSNRIKAEGKGRIGSKRTDGLLGLEGNVADTNGNRLERSVHTNFNRQIPSTEKYDEKRIPAYQYGIQFQNFPTQPPICGGDDGLPTELDRITFSKWRNESIKAYGNAVVPQVVYEIFKAIEQYEELRLRQAQGQ